MQNDHWESLSTSHWSVMQNDHCVSLSTGHWSVMQNDHWVSLSTGHWSVMQNDPRGQYHGGQRPSSDDRFHGATVILLSALDKPSIMKGYHGRRTCSHTSPRRSPTMVTLHDTWFVQCRWWNDGWTVKTVVA